MILDSGFCTIYSKGNGAAAGNMPTAALTLRFQGWYGELGFETARLNTGKQEDVEISARVRVLQDRSINTQDIAVLSSILPPPAGAVQFDIVRAYHGVDEESGEPISDLSLREVQQRYDITGVP